MCWGKQQRRVSPTSQESQHTLVSLQASEKTPVAFGISMTARFVSELRVGCCPFPWWAGSSQERHQCHSPKWQTGLGTASPRAWLFHLPSSFFRPSEEPTACGSGTPHYSPWRWNPEARDAAGKHHSSIVIDANRLYGIIRRRAKPVAS